MKQRKDTALRWLRYSLGALLIVPTLLFAYGAGNAFRSAFQLADERIDHALAISSEQALRIFRTIDVTLDSVEQILRGKTDPTIKASEAELSERLAQFTRAFPDIASIWILDRNADALVSSLFFPVPSAANAPDRAYLKAELAQGPAIHIGGVVQIAMTGRVLFPVSKQRMDSSGTFSGTTEISVLPQAFENFYAKLGGRSSASYALIREDGVVLARYPAPARPGMVLDASTGFGQLMQHSPDGGRYTSKSGIDGLERRFAVRKLPGFPLYVTSSLETREIVRDWAWQMVQYLLIAVPAVVLLALLITLTSRRTAAFYAEAEQREALEQNLRQAQRIEAIGQLTGGIAHDFNNLLTVIMGNLQMAMRRLPEGRPKTQLENAQQGAQRAADLTKRLLAFSRNQALDPKPVDVNRLVATMSDLLGRTLGETISIETIRAAGLWKTELDLTELESAVLNLAVNARDAMPDGGKLTIETANAFLDEAYCEGKEGLKAGQYVMLAVTDTGTGMTKEVMDKAVDPFFTTKPAGVGTGLGLSQVYGFIKQSGGHLQFYSELGEGTTVKLYLPRSLREPAAAAEAPAQSPPRGQGESILVAEDDAAVRDYVIETLNELGYRVLSAADGSAALSLLDGNPDVNVLLTDVVMPGLNGRMLAQEALKRSPRLKVLYMTGYSRNAIVHHGRLDPGVDLIQKPFSQNALAQRLRSLLSDAS